MTTTIRRGTRAWRKLRATWTPLVNTGKVTCRRCHTPIRPGQPWDLGHHTDAALGGTADGAAPEHAHQCNRSAGGRLGNTLKRLRTESPRSL